MRFSDARVVFVHICGPADTVGAGWWCLVRRWVFEDNKLWRRRKTDKSGEEKKKKNSGSAGLEFELLRKGRKKSPAGNSRGKSASWEKRKKKEVITLSQRRKKGNHPERSEFIYAQKRNWIRCAYLSTFKVFTSTNTRLQTSLVRLF